MILLELFFSFAKVGVMTFGGGLAMLPILQREIVEHKGWATEAELTDYFAIGQCTPGIIAVNTATFVGQKQAGILGGILATLGVAFPSVVIITCLASVISAFAGLKVIAHAFAGIRICVCVLIFNALLKLSRSSVVDPPTGLIAVTVALLAFFTDLSPAVFVLCAAVAGLAIQAVKRSRKKEAEGEWNCFFPFTGSFSRPASSP